MASIWRTVFRARAREAGTARATPGQTARRRSGYASGPCPAHRSAGKRGQKPRTGNPHATHVVSLMIPTQRDGRLSTQIACEASRPQAVRNSIKGTANAGGNRHLFQLIARNRREHNSFQEDTADTVSRNRASPMSIKSTCEWEMQSSASGFKRLTLLPVGSAEKPGKERALEVRLVREVQVLNLRSHRGNVYRNVPSHSFRNACMKADQKHAAPAGRSRAEIRKTALADTTITLWWCKARGCEILFCNSRVAALVGAALPRPNFVAPAKVGRGRAAPTSAHAKISVPPSPTVS